MSKPEPALGSRDERDLVLKAEWFERFLMEHLRYY